MKTLINNNSVFKNLKEKKKKKRSKISDIIL